MKFDQAIKEGFANYVSEDEDQISIGRDVLESIRDLINDDDVVKIAVEKHRDNPELFKAINKLIFKVDSLLAPKKEEFPDKDEDEITAAGAGGGVKKSKAGYNVDSAVEREAQQDKGIGAFGMGTKKYQTNQAAKKAVDKRSKLVSQAIGVYNKNTADMEQALRGAS